MSKRGDVALEVLPSAPRGRVPDELLPPPEPGDDEPSLREDLDVLVGARGLIAAAVVAAGAIGLAYALLATPVYRSDALVQVEDQKAGHGLLGDLSAAFGDSTPAEAEILRSRAVVGDVVDELKLDLVAQPRRFPLLGGFLARRHDPADGVAGAFIVELSARPGTEFQVARLRRDAAIAGIQDLAHLGEAGKRVAVVEADLRRGHLHEYYGTDRARGLSDVIGGHVTLEEALRETASANVRFVPTSTMPPNPAELLPSERFTRVLQELAGRFDVVLLDTPPILAVTDAAVIGRHASVNLLVLRAGEHPVREVSAALRAFARGGVRVHGLLNGVRLDRGLGRGSGHHYQYRYG